MVAITASQETVRIMSAPMSVSQEMSYRKAVLSSFTANRAASSSAVSTMPNGDPPSLMLWGDDDGSDSGQRRTR